MGKKDIKEIIKEKHLGDKPDLYIETPNEEQHRLISKEDENLLDNSYENIIKYMRDNYSKGTKELTEGEKDRMYGELKSMWNEISGKKGKLNDVSFDLILKRDEYNLLLDLLKNKLEYDVDTIFYAIELRDMIEELTQNTKFKDENDVKHLKFTPIDMTYLYHLISKYKVKGLNKKAYYFANILTSIGMSSKLINYYNNLFKNISPLVEKWVVSLDGFDLTEDDRNMLGVDKKGLPVLGSTESKPTDEVKEIKPKSENKNKKASSKKEEVSEATS